VARPGATWGVDHATALADRHRQGVSGHERERSPTATSGASTRRMDKLVKTLGIDSLSKSQVSRMAGDLDQLVDDFRHRPLDTAG
jgi:hypothetical protein